MDYTTFFLIAFAAVVLIAALLLSFGINDGDEAEDDNHFFGDGPCGRFPLLGGEPSVTTSSTQAAMLAEDKEIREIHEAAFGRHKLLGQVRYGVFNKEADRRDMLEEAEQELLDGIIYNTFEIARLRAVRRKISIARFDSPFASPWGMP